MAYPTMQHKCAWLEKHHIQSQSMEVKYICAMLSYVNIDIKVVNTFHAATEHEKGELEGKDNQSELEADQKKGEDNPALDTDDVSRLSLF